MALTTRTPPSNPGYDTWTQVNGYFVFYNDNANARLESQNNYNYREDTIYAEFSLSAPANDSQLTVEAKRYQSDMYDLPGYALTEVILRKPDTSEVVLYSQEGGEGYWEALLSGANITEHLTAVGTYQLRFHAKVRSSRDPETGVYDHSYVEYGSVTLKVDTDPPPKVTGLNVVPKSTSSIKATWDVAPGAATYNLYHALHAGSPEWTKVEGITDLYYTVTDLLACHWYDVKVSGQNVSGEGETSDIYMERTNCAYEKAFSEPLGLAEDYDHLKLYLRVFEESLGLTESFSKTKIVYKYKTFSEPLELQESFTIDKVISLGSKMPKLLACRSNKQISEFAAGTLEGVWDTDDLDFGYPGLDKILDFIEFVSQSETPHTVSVYVSTDSGWSWTYIGQDITFRGKNGMVWPWLTAEKVRLRFKGEGLRLQSIYTTAIPVGWELPTT